MSTRTMPHRVHHIRRHRTLLAAGADLWYFAYGANLCHAHMRRHCAHAEPVGPAVLGDFQLVFHGCADVVPVPGATVPGAVWRIRGSDEAALDRYEGYPLHYRKEEHPVELAHGERVTAMLYRMNRGRPRLPNPSYLELIRCGHRDFGLPLDHLETALELARRPLLRRFPMLGRVPQVP